VIRRTVLEWKSLRYGDGADCIPEWAADRLAAVARASPLGGESGARIITHGRTAIRAGQVVGVIAADGCALEILPKIDFPGEGEGQLTVARIRKQLIHMLAVALDIEIASGSVTDLGWQTENLLEILIGLFVRKLADAVRLGMPRRYIGCEEDLTVLRGKLDVTRQFTALAASVQRLACRYDRLSTDIALNQIMKAAVSHLKHLSRSSENQRRLRELDFVYGDIASLPGAAFPWHELVLDRTNARWRELINLAKLLLGNRFQTTSGGTGRGFSLLFEMNILFEEYIARMLKRALTGSGLEVRSQGGRLFCLEDEETRAQRFMTKPDILVKRRGSVELIIDTKWKRLSARIDDPKQGVSQADIYQMMAYGRLYNCPRLMLLYPHHADLRQREGRIGRHRINGSEDWLATATIDVSTGRGFLERLQAIEDIAVVMENGSQFARNSFQAETY
jgi:5-methylcytosine-specific restriction enzyme subunit McrC